MMKDEDGKENDANVCRNNDNAGQLALLVVIC